MICLGKLIVRELWRIYFNFEEHIHLSNRKPNHSMFFTFYILYVPVKLWHFILRTMNRNVQSIQIPSSICISRTLCSYYRNKDFNEPEIQFVCSKLIWFMEKNHILNSWPAVEYFLFSHSKWWLLEYWEIMQSP